jgi:hypothetical protein
LLSQDNQATDLTKLQILTELPPRDFLRRVASLTDLSAKL